METWISQRIFGRPGHELTPEDIRRYQLDKLKTLIDHARDRSPFYREHLRGMSSKDLHDVADLSAFPLTTVEDLQISGNRFLCVSQSEVERVVSLQLPDRPETLRRIYFTGHDLERTIDFFHHGMTTVVHPGQRVLILMPGDRPGSVGDLLAKGLGRSAVQGFVHGIVHDPAMAIREIVDKEIDCLVGIPTQILALARHENADAIPAGRISSVLLSADYVPSAVVNELQRMWGCRVFSHYGTTEMGFGGSVDCEASAGYHVREADLLFEIVDPASARPLPEGQQGEIVFTTLTREAMPLIRYRTGDLSGFLPDPCPCGTVLKRLGKVRGKVNEMIRLRSGDWLGIADLDEVLFALPGIVNYLALLTRGHDMDRLEVAIHTGSHAKQPGQEGILGTLKRVPAIAHATETRTLILEPIRFSKEDWITTGAAKRSIVLKHEQE
ncbi:MAG TPA: AMP-binding protein [Desulfomonilaceae bacterium]|nr:AMP-binding protein [Desulfomonilaceae bacterium]